MSLFLALKLGEEKVTGCPLLPSPLHETTKGALFLIGGGTLECPVVSTCVRLLCEREEGVSTVLAWMISGNSETSKPTGGHAERHTDIHNKVPMRKPNSVRA